MENPSRVADRSSFLDAALGFAEIVDQVPHHKWDHPALGVWMIRDLVGHTSRALSTVESYLAKTPSGDQLDGPVGYFLAVRATLADPEAVAQRGRDAGTALGPDPAATVHALADRVSALVRQTSDDAAVTTPVGIMTLADYLPTRTFELAVHGLDLARALSLPTPAIMAPAITASLQLASALGGELDTAPQLLLLLTGRHELPEHLSVI